MALEISGKIVQIMPAVTGNGQNGAWTKREFVIETSDQYPKKICFSAWNDKAALLDRANPGQEVKVSFDVQSREYNQRWYTDLRIWKLEFNAAGAGEPAAVPAPEEINQAFSDGADNDLPF